MVKYLIPYTRLTTLSLILLALTAVPAGAQTPTETPARTPSVTVTNSLGPAAPGRTPLEALQSEIRNRLNRPELRRGQVGIKIVSLNTGKVVFEENAEKYFMPASNMKNFTVATALEKLTPDYRLVTSVFAASPPDSSGTIKGDLRIFGRGDVSISTAFSEGNYYKGLDDLADKIAAAGVKRIEGSIIGDDSYFKGNALPGSWEWDDLQWYYGAEVSALPLNDNAVDLSITPGPIGYACSVRLSPYNPVYRIKNQCITTAAGTPRTLKIEKLLGQNILEITGTLPVGNAGLNGSVTVTRPAELFAALLKQRLEAKGVTVTGQYRIVRSGGGSNWVLRKAEEKNPVATAPGSDSHTSVEIAKLESPPLALIAAKTMKPSQNMYTETLLWTLGEEARKRMAPPIPAFPPPTSVTPTAASSPKPVSPPASPSPTPAPAAIVAPQQDSAELGIAEVKAFLTGIGIPPDAVLQYDGSGLSRHNLITPSAVVQLYSYMGKQSKYAQAWRESLTIGGVDGTLANRFKGTAAQGNIRGKTGTIDQVSALSGYITTAAGEQLVVSFLVNGVRVGRDRTSMIDDIVISLSRFSGRIDQADERPM